MRFRIVFWLSKPWFWDSILVWLVWALSWDSFISIHRLLINLSLVDQSVINPLGGVSILRSRSPGRKLGLSWVWWSRWDSGMERGLVNRLSGCSASLGWRIVKEHCKLQVLLGWQD
jgi:hypothetical protein